MNFSKRKIQSDVGKRPIINIQFKSDEEFYNTVNKLYGVLENLRYKNTNKSNDISTNDYYVGAFEEFLDEFINHYNSKYHNTFFFQHEGGYSLYGKKAASLYKPFFKKYLGCDIDKIWFKAIKKKGRIKKWQK